MPKTALITGGAGFIGSHLCDRLIKEGYKVICMDSLITGSLSNISHLKGNPNFKFINHNVCEYIDIDEEIDCILHFASPASPIDYKKFPIQTLKVGSLGTHNALGLAKKKFAKFLLASTSEVYGDPTVHPQSEDYLGNVNCIGPRGVYDEAKRFAEAITFAYHNVHHLKTYIARIFNTYGQKMRKDDGRAIPTFITQALKDEPITVFGDGMQTRSFCFILDLVEGIFKLLNSDIHTPVNLGNPEEISILELAQIIKRLTDSKSKISFRELPIDDPKQRKPDISKAKKFLGWEPRVVLEEGLKETIKWFAEAPY